MTVADYVSTAEREALLQTLQKGFAALESLQREDGHFCGELQGDSILESEYLLMKFILGQEKQPMASGASGPETLQKIARCLRSLQRDDGAWGQYPGSGDLPRRMDWREKGRDLPVREASPLG